jgi:hypothetical protein
MASKSAGPKGGPTSASSTGKFPNNGPTMTLPRGNVTTAGQMLNRPGDGGNTSGLSGKVTTAVTMPTGGSPVGRGPGAPAGNTMRPSYLSGGQAPTPRIGRSRVK